MLLFLLEVHTYTHTLVVLNQSIVSCSILRNNSFTGVIPEGMGKLEDLEMLDLGYNNFSGPVPMDLGSNLSLAIL